MECRCCSCSCRGCSCIKQYGAPSNTGALEQLLRRYVCVSLSLTLLSRSRVRALSFYWCMLSWVLSFVSCVSDWLGPGGRVGAAPCSRIFVPTAWSPSCLSASRSQFDSTASAAVSAMASMGVLQGMQTPAAVGATDATAAQMTAGGTIAAPKSAGVSHPLTPAPWLIPPSGELGSAAAAAAAAAIASQSAAGEYRTSAGTHGCFRSPLPLSRVRS